MAEVNWTDGVSGDWTDSADWSGNAVPGSNDAANLGGSESYAVSILSAITVASLAISNLEATLYIAAPGTPDKVKGDFTNHGTVYIDTDNGQGGSALTVSGTLTNSNLF